MPCCTKLRDRMSARLSRSQSARSATESESSTLSFSVAVESLRAFAYCSFFVFVGCAIAINNTAVAPYLAAGPSNGSTCPPFDGAMGDAVDPPVLPGEGFDVHTQSHLIRAFGFNNICVNWDYSPSREITAMIYPVFDWLGGRKGTTAVAFTYLCCNLIISPVKLYLTSEVVFKGAPAAWSLGQVGSSYAGEVVDKVWFVFNAIIPIIVAVIRMLSENPLTFTIDVLPPRWTGEALTQEPGEERVKMVDNQSEAASTTSEEA
ncbi:hypothetical protein ACHAXN_003274 [Cyclotella atomus]